MTRAEEVRAVSAASAPDDAPCVVVSHPMGSEPAPLGLNRPLRLLGGGDRLAPSGMPSALGIDHVPGLRRFVAEASRRQASIGTRHYQQPPLALLGKRGVGKGFVAHWIARHAGVPLYRMPVAPSVDDVESDEGTRRQLPVLPLIAMAASRCANPVIVVELDADAPIRQDDDEAIASMVDLRRNSRWIDERHDAIFDFSHVSWMVEVQARKPRRDRGADHDDADVLAALPPALAAVVGDAGTMLTLHVPKELEELRRLDVAIEVCASRGVTDPDMLALVYGDLIRMVPDKPPILERLAARRIPFVDVGMGLHATRGGIGGAVRTTLVADGSGPAVDRIPTSGDRGGAYSTNIQICELNALNAALAVIAWASKPVAEVAISIATGPLRMLRWLEAGPGRSLWQSIRGGGCKVCPTSEYI